jgi:hypothetical protein
MHELLSYQLFTNRLNAKKLSKLIREILEFTSLQTFELFSLLLTFIDLLIIN